VYNASFLIEFVGLNKVIFNLNMARGWVILLSSKVQLYFHMEVAAKTSLEPKQ
jgi:hypothetical protein